MKERVVPITKIGEYFPIALQGPPPDRHDIYVREEVLQTGLQAARLTNHSMNLNFYRNEPSSTVAASGAGEVGVATGEVVAEEAKQQETKLVHVDPMTEVITWTIPYRDRDVMTPKQTASFGSKALHDAIALTPMQVYTTRFEFNAKEDEVMEFAHWLTDIGTCIIVDAVVTTGGAILVETTPAELARRAAIIFGATYYGLVMGHRAEVKRYKKGEPVYEKKQVQHLAEDPRRIYYPSILFDTWIVPAVMYSLRSWNQPDLLTTKKT